MSKKFFTIKVTVKHRSGRLSKYEPCFYWNSFDRTLSSVFGSLAARLRPNTANYRKLGPPKHAIIRVRDGNNKLVWEHLIEFPKSDEV